MSVPVAVITNGQSSLGILIANGHLHTLKGFNFAILAEALTRSEPAIKNQWVRRLRENITAGS